MTNRYVSAAFILSATLFGAGCAGAPTPQPPAPTLDISGTSCPEIPAARQNVLAAYTAAVVDAEQTWADARDAFQADLNECQRDVWKGGPCDNEWKASQEAAQRAEADIANDDAYYGWKKAKADWDACHNNWEAKYQEWSAKGRQREEQCRDEFNAKNSAAQTAYTDAVKAAKAKRDADLATLDDLEKKCKEKEKAKADADAVSTGGGTMAGGTTGGGKPTGGTQPPKPWVQTPPTVSASACAPAGIPGSNTSPRQGRPTDFGARDLAVNLLVAVAEDVTKTPLPTGAIDNQIFAGIVCVKIRTRIAQMTSQMGDLIWSGRSAAANRLERKITQYNRALSTWCAIAEGRVTIPQVKKDVKEIGTVQAGVCQSDSECGSPLCCSANSIATSRCIEGQCVSMVNACPPRDICMGPDSAQPLYDHCGPSHEGNWGFGQPRPAGSVSSRPAPGVKR